MTLGSIVSSFLTPAQFFAEMKDPPAYDPQVSKWLCLTAPCALGFDVSTTHLRDVTGMLQAPSMLGMFQRGTDPSRNPADRQEDALQGHGHKLTENAASTAHQPPTAPPNGLLNGGYTHAVPNAMALVDSGWGTPRVENETRPVNIAVHFYLRVNR